MDLFRWDVPQTQDRICSIDPLPSCRICGTMGRAADAVLD